MGEIKHAVQRTGSVIGVLSVIAIVIFIGYSIYKVINPDPTTTQKAKTIINNTYNPEDKSLIDFKVWIFRVKIW